MWLSVNHKGMRHHIRQMLLLQVLIYQSVGGYAQELFVFTEPASNMPAKSIGIRASNWLMDDRSNHRLNYQLAPEVMWGVNKNLMLHLDGFASNQNGTLHGDGLGVYGKYRLYTADEVNRHFRMAAFGRLSYNTRQIDQEEIDLARNNSGYSLGLIATQLLHKQAFSTTIGFLQATNNNDNKLYPGQPDEAVNVSISTGRLIFPKTYTSYKQTNVNFLLDLLGQHLIGSDKAYLDVAPAVQFIFNSQTRVDIGFKYQLYSNMVRTTPNAIMIRVEHLLFNVF
jgi:hypothetical protein